MVGAHDTTDPIDAARDDIAGSKDLIASTIEDLSQHQRWLENYRVAETKHERRIRRKELMYQAELLTKRVLRALRRFALASPVPFARSRYFSAASRCAWLERSPQLVSIFTVSPGTLSFGPHPEPARSLSLLAGCWPQPLPGRCSSSSNSRSPRLRRQGSLPLGRCAIFRLSPAAHSRRPKSLPVGRCAIFGLSRAARWRKRESPTPGPSAPSGRPHGPRATELPPLMSGSRRESVRSLPPPTALRRNPSPSLAQRATLSPAPRCAKRRAQWHGLARRPRRLPSPRSRQRQAVLRGPG